MHSRTLLPFAAPLLIVLAVCQPASKSQTGNNNGSLQITISGLPGGPASVNVSGPGGFSQVVSGSTTISNLTAGVYTLTAFNVTAGVATYSPNPTSQAVSISSASNPATVSVAYSITTGALTVTVSGLPGGTSASGTVTGPNSYSHIFSGTTTLTALAPGSYTVAANTVQNGLTYYDPAPTSQIVAVTASATAAGASVTYAVSTGTNLFIDGMYITQATQTYQGTVPLVKDRDGYLRVFARANRANALTPQVRVRWYSSGTLVRTDVINAPGGSVPTTIDEGTLNSSWNLAVPKTLIQPNLSVVADVDPTNAIVEPSETDNSFPVSGTPLVLTVNTATIATVTLIPVKMAGTGLTGNVNAGNQATYLAFTQKIHPIPSVTITLHAMYTAMTANTLEDASGSGWTDVLTEMNTLHAAESAPASQHYMAIVDPNYTSGIAGVAFIGGWSGVTWDKGIADQILAHEIGHNWGRLHSPCGNPANPDPMWPSDPAHAGALIGVYGLDVATLTPYAPSSNYDVMSYCQPYWTSDYTYKGVLNFRVTNPDIVGANVAARQAVLLVWGQVANGRVVLQPAFEIVASPRMPEGYGPYVIEGLDARGATLFSSPFDGFSVADAPTPSRGFTYAIPLSQFDVSRLAGLRVTGPAQAARAVGGAAVAAKIPGGAPVSEVAVARPVSGGTRVTWNVASYPMAMIRDAATGEVLSFARGGDVTVAAPPGGALEVLLSDGVRSVAATVERQ